MMSGWHTFFLYATCLPPLEVLPSLIRNKEANIESVKNVYSDNINEKPSLITCTTSVKWNPLSCENLSLSCRCYLWHHIGFQAVKRWVLPY